MPPGSTHPPPVSAQDDAWALAFAASRLAAGLDAADADVSVATDASGGLVTCPDGAPQAVLRWRRGVGWASCLAADDPRRDRLDLYLPICSATAARPVTIGHLGQSIDGFIATPSGDSQFVTGHQNIVHLHWLRALCDAVVVGAGTVAADNPQLTTRHVAGPHPLRVVFDPARRLTPAFRVFTDATAPTLYVCDRSQVAPGETHVGIAPILAVDDTGPGGAEGQLLAGLRARGCARVFIEGGGVTVSAFLESRLLDRLHIAIAPVLIGNGRPAIRLAPRALLRDCARPGYRVFRMGGDVLFDCDLRHGAPATVGTDDVSRVL